MPCRNRNKTGRANYFTDAKETRVNPLELFPVDVFQISSLQHVQFALTDAELAQAAKLEQIIYTTASGPVCLLFPLL